MPASRPQTVVAQSASPEEAAAIAAAIEQFLRETAPPAGDEGPAESPWVRAARLEAVDRGPWPVPDAF